MSDGSTSGTQRRSSIALVRAIDYKTQNLEPIGGIPELTAEDALLGFINCPRKHFYAVLLYLNKDLTVGELLVKALLKWAVNYSRSVKNAPKDINKLEQLCQLAVMEMYDPRVVKNDEIRRILLNMKKTPWSRVWKKQYKEIYSELNDWVTYGLSYVYNKFNE